MKKIILFFVFAFCFSIAAKTQVSIAVYTNGYWSKWENGAYYDSESAFGIYGDYFGFLIRKKSDQDWNYFFKFNIDKSIKRKVEKEWFVYSGTVEYYICDEYLTLSSFFLHSGGVDFIVPKPNEESGTSLNIYNAYNVNVYNPIKKVTVNATIKIYKYKKHPKLYNIFFVEGNKTTGVAISLGKYL